MLCFVPIFCVCSHCCHLCLPCSVVAVILASANVVGGFVVGEIGTLLRAAFVKTEHRPELSLVLLPPAHQRSGTNTAKLFLAVPYVAD